MLICPIVIQRGLRQKVSGWRRMCVVTLYLSSWLLWLSGCPFIRQWAERPEGNYKLHFRLGYSSSRLSPDHHLGAVAGWQKHMIEVAYLALEMVRPDMRGCTSN